MTGSVAPLRQVVEQVELRTAKLVLVPQILLVTLMAALFVLLKQMVEMMTAKVVLVPERETIQLVTMMVALVWQTREIGPLMGTLDQIPLVDHPLLL